MSYRIFTLTSGALPFFPDLYFLNLCWFESSLLYGLECDTERHVVEVAEIRDLVQVS